MSTSSIFFSSSSSSSVNLYDSLRRTALPASARTFSETPPLFTSLDQEKCPLKQLDKSIKKTKEITNEVFSHLDSSMNQPSSEEETLWELATLEPEAFLPKLSGEPKYLVPHSFSSKFQENFFQEEEKFWNRELRIENDERLIADELNKTGKKASGQMKSEPQKGFIYNTEKPLINASTTHLRWEGEIFNIPFNLEIGICSQMSIRPEKKRREDRDLVAQLQFTLLNGEKHIAPLFGVFDGHSGTSAAAEFAASKLPDLIEKALIEYNQEGLSQKGIYNALETVFPRISQEYKGEGGTSAVVCLILNGELWAAGAGNARASLILNGDGVLKDIYQLSFDHRADLCKKEVEERGGKVSKDGYLMGAHKKGFHLARSLGAEQFRPFISSRPDIVPPFPLSEIISSGGSLMLASSGIHKVGTTVEVANEVFRQQKRSPKTASQIIVSSARHEGSKEDLTFILVRFKQKAELKKLSNL